MQNLLIQPCQHSFTKLFQKCNSISVVGKQVIWAFAPDGTFPESNQTTETLRRTDALESGSDVTGDTFLNTGGGEAEAGGGVPGNEATRSRNNP